MAYAIGHEQNLVDIHVHGAEKYDTRTRRQDDILQVAGIHGQRGTSALIPTVYPGSLSSMRESLAAIRSAMTAQRDGAATF
jgi:N-acetylglucosamine-6-phosphate deacetylase